jgi:hypothetical protein
VEVLLGGGPIVPDRDGRRVMLKSSNIVPPPQHPTTARNRCLEHQGVIRIPASAIKSWRKIRDHRVERVKKLGGWLEAEGEMAVRRLAVPGTLLCSTWHASALSSILHLTLLLPFSWSKHRANKVIFFSTFSPKDLEGFRPSAILGTIAHEGFHCMFSWWNVFDEWFMQSQCR